MPTRADLALRLRVVSNSQRVQTGTRARTILDEAVDSLIKADEELAVAHAIADEAIRGDRVIRQKIDEQAATIEAVKQWRIQWDRDTRRAMAREALTSILYPKRSDYARPANDRGTN